MTEKICISTKKRIDNDRGSTAFMCPSCGQQEIVRSAYARTNAIRYKCAQCGFTGPN